MKKPSQNLKLGGENDWQNEEYEQVATTVNARVIGAYKLGPEFAFPMHVPYAIASFRVPRLIPLETKEYTWLHKAPSLLGKYSVEAFLFEELSDEQGLGIYAAVHERGKRVAIPATSNTINAAAMRFKLEDEVWMTSIRVLESKE